MTTPVLIRGGNAYPITAAQWGLARAHKPIGPVAGLDDKRNPLAGARVEPPAAAASKAEARAASRASMLKQIGAMYGEDARKGAEASASYAARRAGMDPKAAVIGERQPDRAPATMSREEARAAGRRNMLEQIGRTMGSAARAKAEARLGIQAV